MGAWSQARMYFVDLPILIVLVSLVYSATRYERWSMIFVEAGRWIVQLLFFLGAIAVGLSLVSR